MTGKIAINAAVLICAAISIVGYLIGGFVGAPFWLLAGGVGALLAIVSAAKYRDGAILFSFVVLGFPAVISMMLIGSWLKGILL